MLRARSLTSYTRGGLELGELTAIFACQSTDRRPVTPDYTATGEESLTLCPTMFCSHLRNLLTEARAPEMQPCHAKITTGSVCFHCLT